MKNVLRIASDTDQKSIPKKINFTIENLNRIVCPPGKDRVYVYDLKSGLALSVPAGGSMAFYLIKKIGGRPIRLRLGGYPEITIEQARKLASLALAEISEGKDPQHQKQVARAEMKFGDLFDWYMQSHAKLHKRTWQKDEEAYDLHLAQWKSRPLTGITRRDVQALHASTGKDSPYTANRVLALLSTIFNKARMIGYEGINPAQGITRFRENSRDRFLSATELPQFLKALEDEPEETWKDFFYLCLWTGARRGNVQSMRWSEIDLAAGTWRIPDDKFKTGKGMTVHLSDPALEILTRRHNAESEYVFPGHGVTGHIAEPKTAWARLLERAKITDLRLHDLRRTLGSWQAAGGSSLHVIGKSLGHKNVSTTAIYARLNLDPVVQSVNAATAAMLATRSAPVA